MPALGLKQKLLLLLLLSIALPLVVVGAALAAFIDRYHEEAAQQRFREGSLTLAWNLKAAEQRLLAHAGTLAARADLVSSANMVSEYQDVASYEPLIFDVEKQKIAEALRHEVAAQHDARGNRVIAAYDAGGALLAYAGVQGDRSVRGFVSYEQARPVLYASAAGDSAHWEQSAPPRLLDGLQARPVPKAASLKYLGRGGGMVQEAVAPMVRRLPDGSRRTVGFVAVAEDPSEQLARTIAREAGLQVALVMDGRKLAGTLPDAALGTDVLQGAEEIRAGEGGEDREGGNSAFVDADTHLLRALSVGLEDGRPVAIVLGFEKAPMLAQTRRTYGVVLAVLLVSAALAIPLGILVANRTVSLPIRRLAEGAEAIKRGDSAAHVRIDSGDELQQLAESFNEMAVTIRRREAELRQSRVSLAEAQRIAQLGDWEWHPASGQLHCSDQFYAVLGATAADIGGTCKSFLRFVHDEDRGRVMDALDAAVNRGTPYSMDYRIVRAGGDVQVVHEQVEVECDAAGRVARVQGTLQIVTELKAVEATLRKVNRSLKTLSSCNEALVHAEDEAQLLARICRIIVEVGGYRLAWVGFAADDAEKSVRCMARAGEQADYLDAVSVSWGDNALGQGPTGKAIRTAAPQLAQDLLNDPAFEPWRQEAVKRGYASSAALPLLDDRGGPFGALNLYHREPHAFDADEIALLRELAGDLAFGITTLRARAEHAQMEGERVQYMERLHRSMEATIQAIATTVEMRDPYTAGHQRRVARLAAAIAAEMGLPEDQAKGIHMAGIIHDIGKIYIPSEILSRPGRLTDVEFALIKQHPRIGHEIVKGVEFPWPVADMILQHHEKLDGSGYPHGLGGEAIVPGARILTVADVVEAMASHRPYRPAVGLEAALDEIQAYRGTRYDAAAVDACLRLFREKGYSLDA